MNESLRWGLVIATYNRGKILRRCVELAVAQSRPPSEVVIVDASANWTENRDLVLDGMQAQYPHIRWEYVEAKVRSSTTQRNQAIDLATADVLFLIDDDSLMYPGCAAEVMRLYEADRQGKVLGVAPMEASQPPPTAGADVSSVAGKAQASRGLKQRLAFWLERQVDIERLLLPYDERYPDHPLPPELNRHEACPIRYFHGFRMTYRREVIARERFDEFLQRYAAAEDMDASYRVSRHGVLVNALRAQIFHAQDPSARLSRFTRMVLGLMNLAVLYRLKGYNPRALYHTFRWRLVRRLLFDVLRDVLRKRFRLPYARADWFTLRKLKDLLKMSEDELRQWYPTFQVEMIERNPS